MVHGRGSFYKMESFHTTFSPDLPARDHAELSRKCGGGRARLDARQRARRPNADGGLLQPLRHVPDMHLRRRARRQPVCALVATRRDESF